MCIAIYSTLRSIRHVQYCLGSVIFRGISGRTTNVCEIRKGGAAFEIQKSIPEKWKKSYERVRVVEEPFGPTERGNGRRTDGEGSARRARPRDSPVHSAALEPVPPP